jgi:hypothetical protein
LLISRSKLTQAITLKPLKRRKSSDLEPELLHIDDDDAFDDLSHCGLFRDFSVSNCGIACCEVASSRRISRLSRIAIVRVAVELLAPAIVKVVAETQPADCSSSRKVLRVKEHATIALISLLKTCSRIEVGIMFGFEVSLGSKNLSEGCIKVRSCRNRN